MKILIVDNKDKVLGVKDVKDIDYSQDIYRVSALWLTSFSGQVLLAQRALNKKFDPGMWGPAVAGTLEEGETYESNIIKEIAEEIGVTNLDVKPGKKQFINDGHLYFVQWFTAETDKRIEEFKIDKNEVAQIRWWAKKEILNEFKLNPNSFVPSFKNYINKLVD